MSNLILDLIALINMVKGDLARKLSRVS